MYEDYNFGLDGVYGNNTPIIIGVKTLMKFQDVSRYTDLKELGCLDHYFRHLYRAFKYINDSDIIDDKNKYKYSCMVRANLSQYELIMLFYNCLSSNGKERFKPLIETYAIFNNIRVELLAKQEHKDLYEEKAYQWLNDNAQIREQPAPRDRTNFIQQKWLLILIQLLLLQHYWYQYSNKIHDNRHKALTRAVSKLLGIILYDLINKLYGKRDSNNKGIFRRKLKNHDIRRY